MGRTKTTRPPATRPALAEPLTFTDLCELEPKLWDLAQRCLALRALPWHERLRRWHAGAAALKNELTALVGWNRMRPPSRLQSSAAYDVAYQALVDALEL